MTKKKNILIKNIYYMLTYAFRVLKQSNYEKIASEEFDKKTIHSNNLYQIFAYVKNRDIEKMGNVSGMLLYAKTDEELTPNSEYQMSGNKISVKSLDLNIPFSELSKQLDEIIISHFGRVKKKN